MTSHLHALCFDANDPRRLARFWSDLLGRELTDDSPGAPADGLTVLPDDDTGFRLRFLPSEERKTVQNHMHFDLTSTSADDQQAVVDRALRLGARHIDVGQRPEEGHVVLADLEGNEFCVIAPGNKFLAGCGFLGALACDGSQEVGYFWNRALGWPLVWDQEQETAIRSPLGGPKLTWGGPPLMPKAGRSRLHFDLVTPAGGDPQAEVDRLTGLGAILLDDGTGAGSTGDGATGDGCTGRVGRVAMADPDGREFCLLTSR